MADATTTTETKARVTYTAEQKASKLHDWDGTVEGAKKLGVSFATLKNWKDGPKPKAAKPVAAQSNNLLAEIKAVKKLKKYADADKDIPASLRNAISAHFDKLIDAL